MVTTSNAVLDGSSLNFNVELSDLVGRRIMAFSMNFRLTIKQGCQVDLLLLVCLRPVTLIISTRLELMNEAELSTRHLLRHFLQVVDLRLVLINVVKGRLPTLEDEGRVVRCINKVTPDQ